MSLASQRLIVPISPADKKRVEKAAQSGKISTAEFVRRAALSYDPTAESVEAELRGLLDAFGQSHETMLTQLDRTDRALDAALAHFSRIGRQAAE